MPRAGTTVLSRWRHPAVVAGLLVVVTLAVFWPVANCDFLNYDDTSYVTENSAVRNGLAPDSIRWAFTTNFYGLIHPFVWLSFMLDVQWFGLNARAIHLMNLFWHVANVVLLFEVLRRMTRALWPAALVAALFALHPQHVEPVAWISARKDLLSTFFWFLTLGAYIWYARRPSVLRYLPTLVFLALGLLCKPMLVTVPVTLLLLDYWPLNRLQWRDRNNAVAPADFPTKHFAFLLLEKLPLLLLSLATVWLGLHTGWSVVNSFPHNPSTGLRIANGLIAYSLYLLNTVWPSGLACPYPYPYLFSPVQTLAAAVVLGVITVLVARQTVKRPYLIVGWLWFVVTLVPVSGFMLPVPGYQSMADRYTYVPLIGVFILLVWLLDDLTASWPSRRRLLSGLSAIVLIACAVLTARQLRHWRNSATFYQRCLAVTTGNAIAHNNYAAVRFNQDKIEEAAAHFREAIRFQPEYFDAHLNLGRALMRQGRYGEAVVQFQTATRLMPGNPLGWQALQDARASQNQLPYRLN